MDTPDNTNKPQRFRRGRRPGVKLSEYKKKDNPNDRNLMRFSVSLPLPLGRIVRRLKPILDLEYSKIFRRGLDEIIDKSLESGDIPKKLHDQWFEERRHFKDDDFTGTL
jgi:hypothetical protein